MSVKILPEQLQGRSYQLTSISLQVEQIWGETHEFSFECVECNMSI